MEIITLESLKTREVINVCDGKRLGYVNDCQIDVTCGRVIALTVPGECNFLGISKGDDIIVPWECIDRIGNDIILIKVTEPYRRCAPYKKHRFISSVGR